MTVEAAKLDKKARDALPDDQFAVPGKRKLPINDVRHTRLAWDQLDRTQGLTSAEKTEARRRILNRAKELGVDTADWHKVKAMRLEAVALNIENDDDHPNKMPFKGVMTRVGEPSDDAPQGSNGRLVQLSYAAAEAAISSLLGMAVNYQPDFAGHDPKAKIGIITSAVVDGNAIVIEGFLYAADFPKVVERIRRDKDVLGFSFEAQRIYVADPSSDPLEITECVFTGAAILRKDKAAYQTTSLAANAEELEFPMDKTELTSVLSELLAGAMKPVSDRLDKIERDATDNAVKLAAESAELLKKIEANKNTMSAVEPHATALESCAAAMEGAGVGCDASRGHVAILRKMASSLRASAAMGQVPAIFRDHDYPYYASAERREEGNGGRTEEKVDTAAVVAKAVADAMAPLNEKLAAATTQIADLKAGRRAESEAPERKTLPPAITALLARADISLPEGDTKLTVGQVDKALEGLGLDSVRRIQLKNELHRVGALAA